MKLSLPITLLVASSLAGVTMARDHAHDAVRAKDSHQRGQPRPRRLGQAPGHNKAARVADPKKGSAGVSHFSLGHGKPTSPGSGSAHQEDYNTLIVGGDQSNEGEFPYYGKSRPTTMQEHCKKDTNARPLSNHLFYTPHSRHEWLWGLLDCSWRRVECRPLRKL